jgi:predicted RNA-binding Zn-ribbon protein involved in translation (DUF1610 family)
MIRDKRIMKQERRKRFSCPICGTRFPVKSLFTLKDHLVCRKCERKIKPKKQVITFQWGVFMGSVCVIPTGYISLYFGYGNWSIIHAAVVGITGLIIVCAITYIKSEFEEY